MKIQYLKESVVFDIENNTDELDNIVTDNNSDNILSNKNILKPLIAKSVKKYLNAITQRDWLDFVCWLEENNKYDKSDIFYAASSGQYWYPHIFSKKYNSNIENYFLFFADNVYNNKFDILNISNCGQLYVFLENILTQLLSENKIIYNYDINFNTDENHFNFYYTSWLKNNEIIKKYPDTGFYHFLYKFFNADCYNIVTQPNFLKDIINIVLEYLVAQKDTEYHALFTQKDKTFYMNEIDWQNSYIKFNFEFNKNANPNDFLNFYTLSLKSCEFISRVFRTSLEYIVRFFKKYISDNIKNYDFSNFETPLDTGDEIPIILDKKFDKIDTYISVVQNYASIISQFKGFSDIAPNTKIAIIFDDKSVNMSQEEKRRLKFKLENIFGYKNINFYKSKQDYKNTFMSSILKEAISIDLDDEFNDIEEIDDDNNTNQKILNEILDKKLKLCFEYDGSLTEDFEAFLSRNTETYKFCSPLYGKIHGILPDTYKLKPGKNKNYIFTTQKSNEFIPTIKSLFSYVFKQLYLNDNSNKIIYDYDFNYSFTYGNNKLFCFIEDIDRDFSWFSNITYNRFLYNVARCMLDYLVQKNRISSDERKEVLENVNWELSKVLFHVNSPKECNIQKFFDIDVFYTFKYAERHCWAASLIDAYNFLVEEHNGLDYFDFSGFNLLLGSYVPKINFQGFDFLNNSYSVSDKDFINLIVYYTRIIGLITKTKDEDVRIDVICPVEIFFYFITKDSIHKGREEQRITLQRLIRSIYDDYNCLSVKFYDSVESYNKKESIKIN